MYVIICLTAPDRARAVVHVVDGLVVVGSRVGAAGVERRAEAVVDVRCGISIGVVKSHASQTEQLAGSLVTELLTNLTGSLLTLLAYLLTYLLNLLTCRVVVLTPAISTPFEGTDAASGVGVWLGLGLGLRLGLGRQGSESAPGLCYVCRVRAGRCQGVEGRWRGDN